MQACTFSVFSSVTCTLRQSPSVLANCILFIEFFLHEDAILILGLLSIGQICLIFWTNAPFEFK